MYTILTPKCSIGSSANFLSTMLTGNGVPNDVISNFNSLSIICLGPVLNVSSYGPKPEYPNVLTSHLTVRSLPTSTQVAHSLRSRFSYHHRILPQHPRWHRLLRPVLQSLPDLALRLVWFFRSQLCRQRLGLTHLLVVGGDSVCHRWILGTVH